ncbi:Protein unc-93 A [Merluccius polli]|uniref:Protein unc-93 homolog A n=1 Tax=Merluccius polli TaxID=89951 RepID=A0AA47MML7_MERPO|nr:Protein unc-93 A [Merluccius polli]
MINRNLKNVLVVSIGFLSLFTAYGGLQSLQSSLNAKEGMGVASLSIIYASIIISSMFLPPIMIKNLGCKWTIVVSMACYVSYSIGNLYPGWYTLIPTSAILGLGGSPLWSAKCTYLTIAGNLQASNDGKKGSDVINTYFGIFFFIFQSSAVWGNLMSSLIFGQASNLTDIPEEMLLYCGAMACDVITPNTTTPKPEQKLVTTLVGCYIALYPSNGIAFCSITGVGVLAMIIVAVFLDNIDQEQTSKFRGKREPFCQTFLATFRLLKDRRLFILIPLTMYSGFEQSFLSGEYTKNYVTCALGIHFVGYTMICFGATNSVFSIAFGKLAEYTGRAPLFFLAALTNLSCILALLFWRPNPDPAHLPVFFVFPALWGLADAIWQTQTNGSLKSFNLLHFSYKLFFQNHKELYCYVSLRIQGMFSLSPTVLGKIICIRAMWKIQAVQTNVRLGFNAQLHRKTLAKQRLKAHYVFTAERGCKQLFNFSHPSVSKWYYFCATVAKTNWITFHFLRA